MKEGGSVSLCVTGGEGRGGVGESWEAAFIGPEKKLTEIFFCIFGANRRTRWWSTPRVRGPSTGDEDKPVYENVKG